MDKTTVESHIEDRRRECLLISLGKVQKLVRKTRHSRGCNAEFHVINISPAAEHPAELHIGEELTVKHGENFRSLLYDGFPVLLQRGDSPHVSRNWDHPIDTTGPMKRQRRNILTPA
jgi:hypothetical protein